MRLEDAFLYLVIDLDAVAAGRVPDCCAEAVAGGADVLEVGPVGQANESLLPGIASACRNGDALFVIAGDPERASRYDSDGVRLAQADGAVGEARTILGGEKLIGASSSSLDEARLAVAVGIDFLVHEGGPESRVVFGAIGANAAIPMFAGGIDGLETARQMVNGGLVRLCISSGCLDTDRNITEQISDYSRLLGRSF